MRTHSRLLARESVEEIAKKASNANIFICNNPENEAELMDLFPVRFVLVVDETTRNTRLAIRTNNPWGKVPHELEYSLVFGKKAQEVYREYGHTVLDSSQPPATIVDQILDECRAQGLIL